MVLKQPEWKHDPSYTHQSTPTLWHHKLSNDCSTKNLNVNAVETTQNCVIMLNIDGTFVKHFCLYLYDAWICIC